MNDLEYLKKYGNPETLKEDVLRLEKGEPVQYIVGNVSFYGYPININSNVLIPRFETEQLVEKVIKLSKQYKNPRILDLGTGSGCIAIALKKEISCEVVAVDISKEALEEAKKNADLNQVSITFLESDFLENVNGKFDIIVSNPPYITYDEEIMDIVEKYEPHLALYADNNGLACYETILKNASDHLNNGGFLAFEIGYQQGKALTEMANQYFNEASISVCKDLQGKNRFLIIKLP